MTREYATKDSVKPKREYANSSKDSEDSFMGAVTDVTNRGLVAATAGAPVDIINLGLSGIDYLRSPGKAEKSIKEKYNVPTDQFKLSSEKPVGGSEYIGEKMQQAGMVSPTRRPIPEFAAGLAPSLLSGGAGLFKQISKIPTVGKAKAAVGDLAESLKTALGGESSVLARERGTRQETALREASTRFGAEATAASDASKTALNNISKPTNEFQVGEGLRKLGKTNERQLEGTADRAAEVLKTKYFEEGRAKQKAGEYWSQSQTGREFLKYMQDVINPANRGKYTDFEIAAVKDLNQQLQSIKYKGEVIRPEIEKIEKIIRDAKKLPSQATMNGADALKQQHMGKLARKLEDSVYGYVDEAGKAVAGFAPTGRTFHNVYAQMMQPLNAYESQVGKVLAQELQGLRGIFTSDASQIPAKVFQSPEQIKILERMDISKDSLLPFAKQHAANELSKLKTSEEINNWINSTKGSYLQEFPELQKQVKNYADIFAKNESTIAGKQAGKTAIEKKTGEVGKTQEASQSYVTKAIQDVENLQKREPNKVAGEAVKIISDLRQKRLISPEMAAKIETEIAKADKLYEGADKSKKIGYLILGSGLGLYGSNKAYEYVVAN